MTDNDNYIVRDKESINLDLVSYLKLHEKKEMLRILVAGNVDDGKSTLIGRLLYDSHLIYKDHLDAIYHDSKTYNTTDNEFDLSLLTDGLKAEREQGITIDVAYRFFSTEKKSFIICDAPGHEQYTRNMATGATHCDMALIIIDAQNGVKDQTRRHSLIATIMGIRKIVVVVNKMDLVNFNENVFNSIRENYTSFCDKLNIDSINFIPISALSGDNVVCQSTKMSWYLGGPLLNYLENTQILNDRNLIDFRLPVQYVIHPAGGSRAYAGSIASGIIRKGDEVIVLPSRQRTKIRSIEVFEGSLLEAFAPNPVILTIDDQLDISRGMVLAKPNNIPSLGNSLESMIVWMDVQTMKIGSEFLLKSNTQCIPVKIKSVRYKYNINELSRVQTDCLNLNDIGRVELQLHRPLIHDSFRRNRVMGSFILIDRNSNATCGGGIILDQVAENTDNKSDTKNVFKHDKDVIYKKRELLLGHKSATIWLTGLSGSGKTTIAGLLEEMLIERNINVYVLDGDNLRLGLSSNLSFSPEDRSENIRRAAEVARMINEAGVVVIAAFISPYIKDRQNAASIIGENFFEVFIDASIESCKKRDPKGLYAKIADGKISGFTGIDAPYERPENPYLQINTELISARESAEKILTLIMSTLSIK